MDSKQIFYSDIEIYFTRLSQNRIPEKLINTIIEKVTNKIYSDYERFWNQYPKSRKRYSTLKIEDLKHPFIKYLITDFLRDKEIKDFRKYSKILFKMNDEELDNYLEQKNLYETT